MMAQRGPRSPRATAAQTDAAATTHAAASPLADPGIAPDAERLISDVQTLKALSDPLRLRILEMMVARSGAPWSVKELAGRLGVPQTRLYHHIELLVERDLLRVAQQRVVSGIIETRYRVAALSLRLDRRLLAGDATLQAAGLELLQTVFDGARDHLGRALRAHLDPGPAGVDDAHDEHPDRPIVSHGLARMSPDRAAEFRASLTALIKAFGSDDDSAGAESWGLLVAYYRVPEDSKEASHG